MPLTTIRSAPQGSLLMLLGLLLSMVAGPSRAAAVKVDFCSGWTVGQSLSFESTRVAESRVEGGASTRIVSKTPVHVDVVAEDDSGYRIAWTYGRIRVEENSAGPLEAWPLSLFDGLRVELRTDASGRVTRVSNAQRVKEHLVQSRSRLLHELQGMAPSETERVTAEAFLRAATQPGRGAELPLPDAEFLLGICGRSLALGQRQRFERTPAALGGQPTGSFVSFLLRELDGEEYRATVEWRNEESAEGRALVRALFRAAAEAQGEAPDTRLEVSDGGVVEFDLASGWPARVSHERTVRYGKRTQVRRSIFEGLSPSEGRR